MTQTNYNERLDNIVEHAIRKGIKLGRELERDSIEVGAFETSAEYAALTQLFKDLVAEAKPVRKLPENGDSVAVYYEKMLSEFEQNLLKALEY